MPPVNFAIIVLLAANAVSFVFGYALARDQATRPRRNRRRQWWEAQR